MEAPSYNPPPIDPATLQAEQTAHNQTIQGLSETARGDMGSLMAAYGTLAMGMGTSTAGPAAVVSSKT